MKENSASTPLRKSCPYCAEVFTPDGLHVCPYHCCYVEGYEAAQTMICPYCQQTFDSQTGHGCPVLIRLTSPAQ